jgi:predicted ferric reductase
MQPRQDRPIIISFRLTHIAGWLLTFTLCYIPFHIWLQINPLSQIINATAAMLAIGQVTGLIGMVMYALNLIYATRLGFLEYLFGGLNRVYIAHHILGGFALIFLSLHPFFLALRLVKVSMMEVTLLLVPNGLGPFPALFDSSAVTHQQVLQQWAIFFGIIAFWGMVALLLITFFIQIPYRIWLMTHKFLGLFFIVGALHLLYITSDTSASSLLKTYMLTITALGIAAYFYRLLAGKIRLKKYIYTVSDVKLVGGNVSRITMLPTDKTLKYTPGQFVFIRFLKAGPLIPPEWHPFTLTSIGRDNSLSVAAKALGDYTSKLSNLAPGTIAEIEGAYGRFGFANYKNRNQVWIAGGIGITPFISMAQNIPDGDYHVDLYYSVRTASELIEWDQLYNTALTGNGKLRVYPYIGDREQGLLSIDFIEKISGSVAGKDFYICGPPKMMKGLRDQLKERSVPNTSIHTEEFALS